MKESIHEFALKVCNYNISTDNRLITGMYEYEPRKFKQFTLKGKVAGELQKAIIKINDAE